MRCLWFTCADAFSTPPARSFSISANTAFTLFLNGVPTLAGNNWQAVRQTTLPDSVSVIAVQGDNLGDTGGIIASDSTGLVWTNSSWRCTNVSVDGWTDVGFDDSAWPFAYESQKGSALSDTLSGINSNAHLIWTNYFNESGNLLDLTVYCRMKLGETKIWNIMHSKFKRNNLMSVNNN